MSECDTCMHEDKVKEFGDKMTNLVDEIGEDAPCLAAALGAVTYFWVEGQFNIVHKLADTLSKAVIRHVVQQGLSAMKDELSVEFLSSKVATD